jgi:integrase/recombinase XerD
VLSAEQISQMLEAASPRDAALVAILTAGACRAGEALLLQWADISATGTLVIPAEITKAGRSRSVALPDAARLHLQRWRQLCPVTQRDWLFPGQPISRPLSVRGAQKAIAALAAQLGLQGVSSHSFRRSAITAAHQAGLPWRTVAEVSGHADLRSLERYIEGAACRADADAARALLFAPQNRPQP